MKYILIILFSFLSFWAYAQVPVIQRGTAAQVTLDQREMAGFNFYLPRVIGKPVLRPSLQNGGVDTLGAEVYNILDSSVYHWIGGNNWEKNLTIRDTLFLLATKADLLNVGMATFGTIQGNVSAQTNLYDTILGRVRYVDTLLGFIATPSYVNSRGFLTTEVDPIANAKVISISPTYGITGGGSFTLGSGPSFSVGADTALLIPFTDTLRALGIATKPFVNKQIFLDTGRCSTCLVNGGSLNKAIDSIALYSGVTSFNTRTGPVLPQTGDYNYAQVTNAAGLTANQTFLGSNTFNGALIANNGMVLNGTSTGSTSDSILTLSGGVVRRIASFSSTFLTFSDTGRCPNCLVNGGSLNKVIDSIIVSGTAGVASFNGRTGAVVPQSGDYSYSLLSGNGSTAITTLGTITTGTWNASPISNSFLVNSSINTTTDSTGTVVAWGAGSVALGATANLHIPSASATARGVVTTGSQIFGGLKTFNQGIITGSSISPLTDSAFSLGISSFRFNNVYTALPAYSTGSYFITVENYTNGRLEAIPLSSLPSDTIRLFNTGTPGSGIIWSGYGSNDSLHFKSLIAGLGVNITTNSDSTITISAPGAVTNTSDTTLTITGNYNVTNAYKSTRIILNATSATITLPDPTLSINRNMVVFVRTLSASGQTATVTTAAGTIETTPGSFSSTFSIVGVPVYKWTTNGTNWILTE